MRIQISETRQANGKAAAEYGAIRLRQTLCERGEANIVVATGASQLEMLSALVGEGDIPWDRVTVFHLDEYIGLQIAHPASFRKYLWERFHSRLPLPVRAFHYIDGDGDPERECKRLGALAAGYPVDICFAGIGENGHLAFNDPPADFETTEPYLIVELDEACRRQQLGEGWFSSLNDVPQRAISMSIHKIIQSRCMIVTVPDARKAKAVSDSVEGPVTNQVPASILQEHPDAHVFIDRPAASLLRRKSSAS